MNIRLQNQRALVLVEGPRGQLLSYLMAPKPKVPSLGLQGLSYSVSLQAFLGSENGTLLGLVF